MGKALPTQRLGDIDLCLVTGWTWAELRATPPEVVRDLRTLLSKRALLQRERSRS